MSPLVQYRQSRLAAPIELGFGFGFRAMLYAGAPALIAASLWAVLSFSGPARSAGLFGLVFFGAAFLLLWLAYRRAEAGAATRIDENGLYFAHIGLGLPWERIGPAWVVETRQQHGISRQAVVLVRETETLMEEADLFGRILIGVATRAASRAGKPESWGGEALVELVDPEATDREAALIGIEGRLSRLRARAEGLGGVPIGAPLALHAGLTPDALAAIVNAETLARRTAAAGAADGADAIEPSPDASGTGQPA